MVASGTLGEVQKAVNFFFKYCFFSVFETKKNFNFWPIFTAVINCNICVQYQAVLARLAVV